MTYRAYAISWSLTWRCNLRCAPCYVSAFAGADVSQEVTTARSAAG